MNMKKWIKNLTVNDWIWSHEEKFHQINWKVIVVTHLNYVFVANRYKCCKIFYTILCFVFVIIYMLASNVSLIPMTSIMYPYDCKWNKIHAMLYPISVYYMTVTRLLISSYHHPPFAMKFPHIMANGWESIHPVLCQLLFWFQQEYQARRLWSN